MDMLAPEFASFPDSKKGNASHYGQPVKSPESIRSAYNKALRRPAGGDGRAGSKADKILKGAKKTIGMSVGVRDECANTTRAAIRKGGLTELSNKLSKGDLDTPKGYAKNEPALAGSLAGSDIGKVIRNRSQVKGGDLIFWRQYSKGGQYNIGAVTHIGIAADDGLKHQYDHSKAKGFHYRPHWDQYDGTEWFAAVRPFSEGGGVNKPTFALLGEKGPEFVFDADTTAGLNELAPNLLEYLNAAKTKPQLASILQSYAEYEDGGEQIVIISREMIPIPMLMQNPNLSGGMIPMSSSVNTTYDRQFANA
jgi:hypothetical protein